MRSKPINQFLVFITTCIVFLLMSHNALATTEKRSGTFTAFAKVIKVDNNNILHLGLEGDYVFGHLSFIKMPIKGQPFFEEAHALLSKYEGQWLRVTEVKRLSSKHSRSYLAYSKNNRNINMEVINAGLAFPFVPDQPPGQLIDAAYTARDKKIGLWQDENTRLNDAKSVSMKGHIEYMMKIQQDKEYMTRNFYYRDGDKAYHKSCITKAKNYDGFIFSKQSAQRKGLKVMPPCTPDTLDGHDKEPAKSTQETQQ